MRKTFGFLPAIATAAAALVLSATLGTAQAAPKKVVLLINGTLGDKSFFDSANHGMQLLREKFGDAVQTRVVEMSYDETKWQPTLEDVAAQDWDLIIAGTYQMVDVMAQVAPEYPNRKFVLYDGAVDYSKGGFKNVYSITYKQNEGSYLAGVLAEGLIKQGAIPAEQGKYIGFLGGLDIPVINDFLTGYVAGAKSVDPGAKIAVSYIGSFSDAAKGKELALAQYRTGVAVGFNVAGQAGLGQLAAAKEANRLAIGVDSDQSAIFRTSDPATADKVVTSVLKRVDVSLVRAFDLLQQDKLPVGKAEALGLAEGAVGIVDNDVYQKVVPAAVREQVKTAGADIAAGKIQVPSAFGLPTSQIQALREQVRP
jgi:basic membrane protein A